MPYTGERLSSYLSQTGYIPANARSMQFKSNGGALVTLNGQPLNPQILTTTSAGGNVFHADVTKFAGTTAELRFTVQPNPPPSLAIVIVSLDSIAFSTRPWRDKSWRPDGSRRVGARGLQAAANYGTAPNRK